MTQASDFKGDLSVNLFKALQQCENAGGTVMYSRGTYPIPFRACVAFEDGSFFDLKVEHNGPNSWHDGGEAFE